MGLVVDDDAVAGYQQDPSHEHVAGSRSLQALFHQRLEFIVASAQFIGQSFLHLVEPSGELRDSSDPYNRDAVVSSPFGRTNHLNPLL